jgi:hypothetical protein
MKPPNRDVSDFDPEVEDTDPEQRPRVHSAAIVAAVAELGLLPPGIFRRTPIHRKGYPERGS